LQLRSGQATHVAGAILDCDALDKTLAQQASIGFQAGVVRLLLAIDNWGLSCFFFRPYQHQKTEGHVDVVMDVVKL